MNMREQTKVIFAAVLIGLAITAAATRIEPIRHEPESSLPVEHIVTTAPDLGCALGVRPCVEPAPVIAVEPEPEVTPPPHAATHIAAAYVATHKAKRDHDDWRGWRDRDRREKRKADRAERREQRKADRAERRKGKIEKPVRKQDRAERESEPAAAPERWTLPFSCSNVKKYASSYTPEQLEEMRKAAHMPLPNSDQRKQLRDCVSGRIK
jgi:hypothetical protein